MTKLIVFLPAFVISLAAFGFGLGARGSELFGTWEAGVLEFQGSVSAVSGRRVPLNGRPRSLVRPAPAVGAAWNFLAQVRAVPAFWPRSVAVVAISEISKFRPESLSFFNFAPSHIPVLTTRLGD